MVLVLLKHEFLFICRSQITKDIVEQCRNFVENSHFLDFNKCSNIQADAFRFLRNCCVGSKKNQDIVMYVNIYLMRSMQLGTSDANPSHI